MWECSKCGVLCQVNDELCWQCGAVKASAAKTASQENPPASNQPEEKDESSEEEGVAAQNIFEEGSENVSVGKDELFEEAKRIVLTSRQASTSYLQRRLKLGYSRAARLVDQLEAAGVIGPQDGAKPRKILSPEQAEDDSSEDSIQGEGDSSEDSTQEEDDDSSKDSIREQVVVASNSKKKSNRGRSILFSLVALGVILGAAATLYIINPNPNWHLLVRAIRIVPPDVLSPQSVSILEDKILGKDILLLDLKKIQDSIELGPGAQSISVTREMPSTVRIEIRKRRPVANVQLRPNGPYVIVATDGVILSRASNPEPVWIIMEDYSEPFEDLQIGAKLQNKGFLEALKFMDAFKKHELSRQETITRLKLDVDGNVTVRLGGGPDFQIGRKPSERLSVLAKAVRLFEVEPRENIEYIDLQGDRVGVKRSDLPPKNWTS